MQGKKREISSLCLDMILTYLFFVNILVFHFQKSLSLQSKIVIARFQIVYIQRNV